MQEPRIGRASFIGNAEQHKIELAPVPRTISYTDPAPNETANRLCSFSSGQNISAPARAAPARRTGAHGSIRGPRIRCQRQGNLTLA